MANKTNSYRKISAIVICSLILLISAPASIYIPWVQDWACDIAEKEVSKATGWNVGIDGVSIDFPIDAVISGFSATDSTGDTIVAAEEVKANIALLPLLKLKVEIGSASAKGAQYNMVSVDSSLTLKARVNECLVSTAGINLNDNSITIGTASVDGGDIALIFDSAKSSPTTPDSTQSSPWHIELTQIALNDINYKMRMPGTIDTLTASLKNATGKGCIVDTEKYSVDFNYIGIDGLDVHYLFPESTTSENAPSQQTTPAEDEKTSLPWTIRGKKAELLHGNAVYALTGSSPADGMDFNHISAEDINFTIENFYNRGAEISVPVISLTAKERSGIEIVHCKGTFAMDSVKMNANDWEIATQLSQLTLDASADFAALEMKNSGAIRTGINASLNLNEIAKIFPMLKLYTQEIPTIENSVLTANVDGTIGDFTIHDTKFEMPRYAKIELSGHVRNAMSKNARRGGVNIAGELANINFTKPSFLEAKMHKTVNFPPMQIAGDIKFNGNTTNGGFSISNEPGDINLHASLAAVEEEYDVELQVDSFPVNSILPYAGIGMLTASIKAGGKGLNPLDTASMANVAAEIKDIVYDKKLYSAIRAEASVSKGVASAKINSANKTLNFSANAYASIINEIYDYRLDATINNIDLQSLNLSETTLNTRLNIASHGVIDLNNGRYDVNADIRNLNVNIFDYNIGTDLISCNLLSEKDTTIAQLSNRDFKACLKAGCQLDTLASRLGKAGAELSEQIERKYFTFNRIDSLLPHFTIEAEMGEDNIIHQYATNNKLGFERVKFKAHNDSLLLINGNLTGMNFGSFKLDTINIDGYEKRKAFLCGLHIGTRRGNLDQMAQTDLHGYLSDNYFNVLLDQRNRKGETGFYFGINGELTDSLFLVSLFPEYPIIGFNEWELNYNNFIEFNHKNGMFSSNILLTRNNSTISLLSGKNRHDATQEDVDMHIRNIDIAEWTRFTPLAPDISGVVSADARISYNDKNYWGTAALGIDNLVYNKTAMGNIKLSGNLAVNPLTDFTDAMASLSVDGVEALTAKGVLNDTTANAPMQLSLEVSRLPIGMVEAFVPGGFIKATGFMVGNISLTGSSEKPVLNGNLSCDSASIMLPAYSTRLRFGNDSLKISDNVVRFDRFSVLGTNDSKLFVDGKIDISNPDKIYTDLSLKGKNVQIVDSKNTGKSELFGKGYIDIDASANGSLNHLKVRANLNILEKTSLTYVMPATIASAQSQTDSKAVRFVEFADTTGKKTKIEEDADFTMNLSANINVEQGSTFNVWLSPNGNDRAQIRGNGTLSYRINSQGDEQFNGRLSIDEGSVKYHPPLISEKNFTIQHGSYASWSGDMLNPYLNIKATSQQTTTVISEEEGAQRVRFNITAAISNTLNDMDLKFDLTAENNLSVQSELLSMTPDQRSTQAINLMLYNNYTGSIASSASGSNVNMLYSFLSSQINSWASKVVKGVDISLGINEYKDNKSASGTNMNYSYRISKSLFNDRFRMTVGGNYDTSTTGDNAIAQNLLNDVSFEYLITPSGTMSVQIFSHMTHDNIFKENVTETGAAFVIRRKLNNLRDMFKFGKRAKENNDTTTQSK